MTKLATPKSALMPTIPKVDDPAVQRWITDISQIISGLQRGARGDLDSISADAAAAINFTTQNVVTGSRALGTVYRNTTGKTMFVSVTFNVGSSTSVYAYTDSNSSPTTVVKHIDTDNTGNYYAFDFMVLNGNYYKVSSGTILRYWVEWY